MNNSSTTAYWIAAAIILVLLVIGVALWYGASTDTRYMKEYGASSSTPVFHDPSYSLEKKWCDNHTVREMTLQEARDCGNL